jgi:hypothetical protein
MPKQILNSFKELSSLLSNVSISQKPARKQDEKFKKSASKVAKKANNEFKPIKPMDPKLQIIFNALNWLKTTFPKAFVSPPAKVTPLKIGIGHDITNFLKAQEDCQHSLTTIRKALSMYTNNFRYLTASKKAGNIRIDLEGNKTGEVTTEQAEYAQAKLNSLNERKKNKANNITSITAQSNDVIHHE